jgi:TonB family protein
MIAALDHASVLLIGEEKNFLDQGGMINLALTNGKISFDVNSASLEHTHIRYGTNLPAPGGQSEAGVKTESSHSLKTSKPPEYPAVARQLNLRGTVRLEALVRADGSVNEVHIVGGHPMLAEAALQAVMQWRYEAAPKETMEVVKVNFEP